MQNQEDNLSKLKEKLFDMAFQATRDKFGVLPLLSGLTLALLALGSAGELFTVTTTVKYLATILLLLMILSLQVYYTETIELNTAATNKFHELVGLEEDVTINSFFKSLWFLVSGRNHGKKSNKGFFERFSSQFPSYAMLILWFVVFMMIWEIWK